VRFRLFVQRLGGQVDAAWPHDGARLSIEFNLGKMGRIVKRFQDACPALRREVDVTGRPVAKQQPEHVVANLGHAFNDRKVALAHRNSPLGDITGENLQQAFLKSGSRRLDFALDHVF
jgi:hypothetical protein